MSNRFMGLSLGLLESAEPPPPRNQMLGAGQPSLCMVERSI